MQGLKSPRSHRQNNPFPQTPSSHAGKQQHAIGRISSFSPPPSHWPQSSLSAPELSLLHTSSSPARRLFPLKLAGPSFAGIGLTLPSCPGRRGYTGPEKSPAPITPHGAALGARLSSSLRGEEGRRGCRADPERYPAAWDRAEARMGEKSLLELRALCVYSCVQFWRVHVGESGAMCFHDAILRRSSLQNADFVCRMMTLPLEYAPAGKAMMLPLGDLTFFLR